MSYNNQQNNSSASEDTFKSSINVNAAAFTPNIHAQEFKPPSSMSQAHSSTSSSSLNIGANSFTPSLGYGNQPMYAAPPPQQQYNPGMQQPQMNYGAPQPYGMQGMQQPMQFHQQQQQFQPPQPNKNFMPQSFNPQMGNNQGNYGASGFNPQYQQQAFGNAPQFQGGYSGGNKPFKPMGQQQPQMGYNNSMQNQGGFKPYAPPVQQQQNSNDHSMGGGNLSNGGGNFYPGGQNQQPFYGGGGQKPYGGPQGNHYNQPHHQQNFNGGMQPMQHTWKPKPAPAQKMDFSNMKSMAAGKNLWLVKKDPVKEKLEKLGVKEDTDVSKIKDLIKSISDSKKEDDPDASKDEAKPTEDAEDSKKKEDVAKVDDKLAATPRRPGAIDLSVFLSVIDTAFCQDEHMTEDTIKCCVNVLMVEREGRTIDAVLRKPKPINNKPYLKPRQRPFRNEVTQETREMQEKAKKNRELIESRKMNSKTENRIKLYLNQLSPDNFEKKIGQLREIMFPEFKTKTDCFEEDIEFDQSIHLLTDENLNEEVLQFVVSIIFKKAQDEKLFIILNGQLCQRLIELELSLRDKKNNIKFLKFSKFREKLLNECQDCFKQFFKDKLFDSQAASEDMDKEEFKQAQEQALIFKMKLFGNIEFVGELYIRKILRETTLISVFHQLLALNDDMFDDNEANDQTIEGAINLMYKCGYAFEQNVKNANDKNLEQKTESLTKIFNRFQQFITIENPKISQRVRLLIKNLFAEKSNNWENSRAEHEKGLKTKMQVQKEVEEKALKEQQARGGGHKYGGGGGDRGDRGDRKYHDDNRNEGGRRNNDRDRGERGGGHNRKRSEYNYNEPKSKFQPKKGNDDRKKDGQDGKSYGNGNREPRNNNNRNEQQNKKGKPVEKVEYEEIAEDEMANLLKSNFESYCKEFQEAQEEEQEGTREEAESPKKIKPEYELFQKLANVNGKKGDEVVSALLSSVFDEDTMKIEKHLTRYFDLLLSDKILKSQDINQGLTRFSDNLPDLALDCPQIHKYLMNYLIKPLRKQNIVQYKFISWKFDKTKKDDDDEIIFGTNPFFKLLALILVDMTEDKMTWKEVCQKFDAFKWRAVVDEKHTHLEDHDDLWQEIKDEIGESNADIVIPLLNRAADPDLMGKKLEEALNK